MSNEKLLVSEHEKSMKLEGEHLVEEAAKLDLHLRLLGAIAFQAHCPKFNYFTAQLNRVLSDIDFAGYGRESSRIGRMMRDFGYEDQRAITIALGNTRMIWESKPKAVHVDIFLDKLEMNHTIPFKNRLGLEPLTIPLADMLLEKMQIVHIEKKDIIDAIMLFREHEIGSVGPETIDMNYITKMLSKDWGFYYTVTTNLRKVRQQLSLYKELDEEDLVDVRNKIGTLIMAIDNEPKPMSWQIRAKIGTKRKWYNNVEEVTR